MTDVKDMPEDLEWLARNVSVWPSENSVESELYARKWDTDDWSNEPIAISRWTCSKGWYSKDQWQSARQQLGLEPESMSDGVTETHRTAEAFLHEAAELMAERGKQYDQEGGERSMGKTVKAFNAITGKDLTESEGWLLMSLLKRVRQHSGAGYHKDSAEDAVAYAALEAESLEASQ